jgi:hypothetical protein
VFSYGNLRKQIVVTRYSAPAPPNSGRPTHLAVTRVGRRAVQVRWRRAAEAIRYEVIVHTSDGAHLRELTPGNQHTLTIHDSVPITAGAATVIALAPGARPDGADHARNDHSPATV